MTRAARTLPILLAVWLSACGNGGSDEADIDPAVSGLDARPSNATCLAPARPEGEIALERAFPNLPFSQPVLAIQAPGNGAWWYLVERGGRIYRFDARDSAAGLAPLVVNLSGRVNSGPGEGGLLGMAFHPDFPNPPQIFLSYTGDDPVRGFESRIARFIATADGATIDPDSEEILLTVDQPFGNHNGGHIAFGADGYLYIGLGDGGSGGDPQDNAQNTNNLLGAMLRIDVDSAAPYAIPSDNPFASAGGRPEIYAWGLRNPWRWSFDRADGGTLWAGDVGQNAWEEIDLITRGGNYGWRCYEGNAEFNTAGCLEREAYAFPVSVYGRGEGRSVTGGYVYRGDDIEFLRGTYVFGDFATGRVWGLTRDGGAWQRSELLEGGSGLNIASFAEDNDGELYVLDYGGTGLWRFVLDARGSASGPSALLSETGCVDPADPRLPAPGLVPYTIKAPFWSDGADKTRFLAVPDGTRIGLADDGDFRFPPGTVLLKHFRLGGQIIETRLFVRHDDGGWAGYTYAWNDSQSDAELLDGAADEPISGQTWHYPSRGECIECHTSAAGSSLGPEARQLDTGLTYPSTGRTANQLDTLSAVGLLQGAVPDAVRRTPLVDPTDPAEPLAARARSYLHSNCAGCHRPGGIGRGTMDLRITASLAQTGACDVAPTLGDLGIVDARLLAPGEPDRSILLERMRADRTDPNRMPPVASNVVDRAGVDLIEAWIDSLRGCD